MTLEMARRVLDRLKDGADYSEQTIRQALIATGDLEESLY